LYSMRTGAREGAPPAYSGRLLATAGLMAATAMQAADALIVNVALPDLEKDLGGGIELGAWVITSYLCATAVTAPLTGWLRRRYGARRLFTAAVSMFITTSLLCAVAPSAGPMIVFRVLQGAAGGIILPLVQAILLDVYPQERHGRMMGILGAVFMLGPILGPPLGGIVTDAASWRAVFAINLPLGLLVLAVTRGLRSAGAVDQDLRLDLIGLVLLMVAIAAVELCLERGVGRSWLASPELLVEASIGVLAAGVLAWRARRSTFAILRLEVFRDTNFSVACFYNFITSGLVFVVIVFLPAIGEGPLGYTATVAGVTIVPRAILLMLMMLAVGELIGKIDYRLALSTGWLLMAAGAGILSEIRPEAGFVWMVIGSAVQSLGAGLLFTPHTTLAYSTLAAELRTEAAGVFSLLRQLGYASGVALMTALLQMQVASHLANVTVDGRLSQLSPQISLIDLATLDAYSDCFRLMAATSLIVIPGIFLFRIPRRKGSGQTLVPEP
jgi:MFS transporter, DHA2 family, multidrug resistance protein